MGKAGSCLCKVVDGVLLVYFVIVAIAALLLDAPICLPGHLVPSFSVKATRWHVETTDDYLVSEVPNFFVGLIYLDLFFQWPLALASVYAIAASKSWFATTALIYGVSAFSISAALISEITLSKQASVKTLMIYYPYLGFGVLALFHGLFVGVGKKGEEGPVQHAKKRA